MLNQLNIKPFKCNERAEKSTYRVITKIF